MHRNQHYSEKETHLLLPHPSSSFSRPSIILLLDLMLAKSMAIHCWLRAENQDLKKCFFPVPFLLSFSLLSYYQILWYSMIIATKTISILLSIEWVSLISQMLVYTKEGDYLRDSTENVQLCKVSVPHNVSLIHTNGRTDFIWVAQAFTVQTFQC